VVRGVLRPLDDFARHPGADRGDPGFGAIDPDDCVDSRRHQWLLLINMIGPFCRL
jgi:hypothetical protein